MNIHPETGKGTKRNNPGRDSTNAGIKQALEQGPLKTSILSYTVGQILAEPIPYRVSSIEIKDNNRIANMTRISRLTGKTGTDKTY